MTEAPKKPVRKKAVGRTAAKKPEPQTKPESKTKPKARKMSDEEMREAVLAKALPHAAFDGFTDKVLQTAGEEAGVSKADLARLFEDGPISLNSVSFSYPERANARVLKDVSLKVSLYC